MTRQTNLRTCPQCGHRTRAEVREGTATMRCPRCGGQIELRAEDNLVDQAAADSFPASDPPAY